ncbi:MAG: hypothetical protein NTAFB05_04610 [Nitrobacter sp.]
MALGPWVACVLEAIDRYGSISAAAPAVGVKFRHLWKQVQKYNTNFKEPVIETRRRGRNGGVVLTPLGKEVVRRYREMERITNDTLEKHYREFEALVGIDSTTPPFIPRLAQVIDPDMIVKPTKKRTKTRQPAVKRASNKKAKTRATKRAPGRSREGTR